jgi:hypothetical protein
MHQYTKIPLSINTVELQRKDYSSQVLVDEREIESCRRLGRVEEFFDQARGALVMNMRASIYGKDHAKQHLVRYPETWWDAVKEKFAPAWFCDRYPVSFVVISTSIEELYPDFKPALPDMSPVVRINVAKQFEIPIW